jgi:hypothetical protein
MTRVVATLETHDGGRPFRKEVHQLSLAFVPPLGTDHNNIFAHMAYLLSRV